MITAIVLAKNEEQTLARCIASLSFCKEIIVIDDYSTDNTVSLAKSLRAKVYRYPVGTHFAKARNWAMKKAKFPWILFIDADELVTPALTREIRSHISQSSASGFYLLRRDVWLGKLLGSSRPSESSYGDTGSTWILRLGKKKGRWKRKVHEYWDMTHFNTEKIFSGELLHMSHPSVFSFIATVSSYSTLHAKELVRERGTIRFYNVFSKPVLKFLYIFFYQKGYIDGMHGFVFAGIMSLHSFLSWTQAWFLKRGLKRYS